MFLAALLALIPPSIASQNQPLKLVVGISRSITMPFEIDPPNLPTKSGVLNLALLVDGSSQNKILLIPTGAGTTSFLVHKRNGGKRALRVSVEVAPASDSQAVEDQIASQRQAGVRIERLELPLGKAEMLDFPKEIGPIYLTSQIVSYQRAGVTPQHSSLKVVGVRNGLTDLVVHDANGEPIVKYVIEVKGKAEADRQLAQTPCEKIDGSSVQYFDVQNGQACPVY